MKQQDINCITEGRKQQFGEPSFVASIRLPQSMRDDFYTVKQQYNIANELKRIVNQQMRHLKD
ncbi:hypothetical protein HNP12_000219 [Aeromonas hydrophila]|uniref:hypothetical protein n=1 Tax=Aeromonas TaxID=642 RepID=UPI00216A6CC6|nr:hypothetical protein [Aeromonas hydrophila]MCS3766180.1 hypothetical protein [Aeromonas hydrophila]